MSKSDPDLPERLSTTGASDLERRLLTAASREEPSRELSERMARAIGVSLPAVGNSAAGGAKTSPATPAAAAPSSSLLPWISGAFVAAIVAGAFVATRSGTVPSAASSFAASDLPSSTATSALAAPVPAPSAAPSADTPTTEPSTSVPVSSAAPHGRKVATASDLAAQIALVDAARAALSGGAPERALTIVQNYQVAYPMGTFRPEVGAIKIEALSKLGRSAEARTLAERFVTAYGPSPLADRVAHLAGLSAP